jgi:hypothetical protein
MAELPQVRDAIIVRHHSRFEEHGTRLDRRKAVWCGGLPGSTRLVAT